MKLNIVTHDELEVTPVQEKQFISYSKSRRRLNLAGQIIIMAGFLLFFTGMFLSLDSISEAVSVLGLVALIIGLVLLAFTKCPFCKKVTVLLPFNNGGRCINCHREIGIND
ncbi:MAG: DUF2207 domain-containing protein [Maribacter sp.]|nr:DUF2207 domain-containing protein [Maribacter sp.]